MSYPPHEIVYFLEKKDNGEYELPEAQLAEYSGDEQWQLHELREVTYERGRVHALGVVKDRPIIVEHLGDRAIPHIAASELKR